MIPATEPLFEVARTEPDPLAAAIRRIVPQATRKQVADLEELLARMIEDYAGAPKVRPR
jgi:hypothetical protein